MIIKLLLMLLIIKNNNLSQKATIYPIQTLFKKIITRKVQENNLKKEKCFRLKRILMDLNKNKLMKIQQKKNNSEGKNKKKK